MIDILPLGNTCGLATVSLIIAFKATTNVPKPPKYEHANK